METAVPMRTFWDWCSTRRELNGLKCTHRNKLVVFLGNVGSPVGPREHVYSAALWLGGWFKTSDLCNPNQIGEVQQAWGAEL